MTKINTFTVEGETAIIDVSTPKFPGAKTIIDLADLSLVIDGKGKWSAATAGDGIYIVRSCKGPVKRGTNYLHIYLLGKVEGKLVDHRDGDPFNNRRGNLRHCSRGQNRANSLPNKNHSSRFKGVSYSVRKTSELCWRSFINYEGKMHHLGYFSDEIQAAKQYDTNARLVFGEFAKTNFQ